MTSRSKGKTWANDDTGVLKGGKDGNTEEKIKIAADSDDDLYEDLPAKKPNDEDDEGSDEDDDEQLDEDGVSMGGQRSHGRSSKSANDPEAMDIDNDNEPRNNNEQDQDAAIAQIEDTGRLFVRNLTYTCTEADLKDLFSQYGPLSEVSWIGRMKKEKSDMIITMGCFRSISLFLRTQRDPKVMHTLVSSSLNMLSKPIRSKI